MKTKLKFITYAAIIAAIYVVLTYFLSEINLASGFIQCRISEALCVLPYFTPAAIPGLTIGCIISNVINGFIYGFNIFDVIFGSLATLLGAIFSYLLKKYKWLVPIPPIFFNTLIVPFILRYAYGDNHTFYYLFISIGIGEFISAGILGMLLLLILEKYKSKIFK